MGLLCHGWKWPGIRNLRNSVHLLVLHSIDHCRQLIRPAGRPMPARQIVIRLSVTRGVVRRACQCQLLNAYARCHGREILQKCRRFDTYTKPGRRCAPRSPILIARSGRSPAFCTASEHGSCCKRVVAFCSDAGSQRSPRYVNSHPHHRQLDPLWLPGKGTGRRGA